VSPFETAPQVRRQGAEPNAALGVGVKVRQEPSSVSLRQPQAPSFRSRGSSLGHLAFSKQRAPVLLAEPGLPAATLRIPMRRALPAERTRNKDKER